MALAITTFFAACGNDRAFDAKIWASADARARGRMSEDLVKRKILVGRSADEVHRMLGQPDTAYPATLCYNIDMGMPLKDPSHYGLQVHLDENRNVRLVKIVD